MDAEIIAPGMQKKIKTQGGTTVYLDWAYVGAEVCVTAYRTHAGRRDVYAKGYGSLPEEALDNLKAQYLFTG